MGWPEASKDLQREGIVMAAWPIHIVNTQNVSLNSENKIHDDAEAKKYGFNGGLVPGTVVYGHMTYPLVSHYGIGWLTENVGHLKLFKPAYEGDKLTIKTDEPEEGHHLATVHCYNALDVELAKLETGMPGTLPAVGTWAGMAPAAPSAERTPISWDAVVINQPLREYAWTPTEKDQETWCHAVSDLLPIYRSNDSPVHPGLILQAANHVLSRHYILKPWIHMESRIVTRSALRVGKAVSVRAAPVEKWEKNGHQFLKLYVCMLSGGKVAVEVQHSAIFQVRLAKTA